MKKTLKKVHILRYTLATIIGLCFFLIINVAGALEINIISLSDALISIIIYSCILFLTWQLYKMLDTYESELKAYIQEQNVIQTHKQQISQEKWKTYFEKGTI